jgi:hypothetical protein
MTSGEKLQAQLRALRGRLSASQASSSEAFGSPQASESINDYERFSQVRARIEAFRSWQNDGQRWTRP